MKQEKTLFTCRIKNFYIQIFLHRVGSSTTNNNILFDWTEVVLSRFAAHQRCTRAHRTAEYGDHFADIAERLFSFENAFFFSEKIIEKAFES